MSQSTFTSQRRNALLALAILVPAPLIGTWFGFYSDDFRGSQLGQTIYFISKLWILLVPAAWLLLIDRGRPSLSPVRRGGLAVGLISGLAISLFIVAAWLLAGRHLIDPGMVRDAAVAAGIGSPLAYALFALYICTVNAVLEEYVWRWFVFRKSEDLLKGAGAAAVVLSALLFTVHHVLALLAQFTWPIALLASAGVFTGGCIWSALYLRYRSIWPGFVSHAIVDVAIFLLGAWILFF